MLPALQLQCEPGEGHTFTRRPLWIRPLESMWGIMAKWQFVNRLPYASLATSLLTRSATASDQGIDLRLLGAFRLERLVEHSGLSHSMLASATCCSSADSETIRLVSPYLRFCGVCMQEGFHAVLFQFLPIRICPIHRRRLHESCPNCRAKIPYRLDASSVSRPFACPLCAHSLLADPTVLARQRYTTAAHDIITSWQRFLATFAYWYANQRARRDAVPPHPRTADRLTNLRSAKRLEFVGSLQDMMHDPPPLPTLRLPMSAKLVSNARLSNRPDRATGEPDFSRALWPGFYTRGFLTLYRRYSDFSARLQTLTLPHQRQATKWWRRSWEGEIARPCSCEASFICPPFGIAEWAVYSLLPKPPRPPSANFLNLSQRFEQDLRLTWQAWEGVVIHTENHCRDVLHPYLVPPRACWLTAPEFNPGSPALGF